MLWFAMYEQQCAMHTLYDCFANVCRPICVVPVFATNESNFDTYTGFQLKTNEIIIRYIHLRIRYTRFLAEFQLKCYPI